MLGGLLVAELTVLGVFVVLNPTSFFLTTVVVGFVIVPTLGLSLRRLWGFLR